MDAEQRPRKKAKMAEKSNSDLPTVRYQAGGLFERLRTSGVGLLFDKATTFAVLHPQPEARGHSVLVVKHTVATLLDELPPEITASVLPDLAALARATQTATGAPGE